MKITRLAAAAGLLIAAGATGVVVAAPANAYPAGTVATATINKSVFAPGQTATVTVHHVTPGGVLTMTFQSSPQVIADGVTVPSSNTTSISGAIPSDAELGAHTIRVTSTTGEGFSFAIVVQSGGGTGTGNGGGNGGGGGGLANTGAAVTGIGILGGILVAGGVFFVVAGRRRTAANQTPSV